jgi:hypothetical protein
VAQAVDFAGGDTWLDEGRDVVEDLGPKAASHAHLGDVFGGVQVNAHAASPKK